MPLRSFIISAPRRIEGSFRLRRWSRGLRFARAGACRSRGQRAVVDVMRPREHGDCGEAPLAGEAGGVRRSDRRPPHSTRGRERCDCRALAVGPLPCTLWITSPASSPEHLKAAQSSRTQTSVRSSRPLEARMCALPPFWPPCDRNANVLPSKVHQKSRRRGNRHVSEPWNPNVWSKLRSEPILISRYHALLHSSFAPAARMPFRTMSSIRKRSRFPASDGTNHGARRGLAFRNSYSSALLRREQPS